MHFYLNVANTNHSVSNWCITNGNYVSNNAVAMHATVAVPDSADSNLGPTESGPGRFWDHHTGPSAYVAAVACASAQGRCLHLARPGR